ncbi:MAG TPA: QsdR family transcriptional regulator [Actinospica sp.]|nr:QsdR family transcriptional regulator [Actinospica sp.]
MSLSDSPDHTGPGAVERAARWFAEGRRLDMQGLADELGISRTTLFRRVGGRETLLARAVWAQTERSIAVAVKRWERERPARALHTTGSLRHFNAIVSTSPGLRRFLDDEPAVAVRILMDPAGLIQPGTVAAIRDLLLWDIEEHGLEPVIDAEAFAYALVRIGESFLYADVIAARTPDVDKANRLQQALIESGRN